MSELDIWRIYGSRQDTDAVVIRELDRDRIEAVRNAEDARRTIDSIHKALHKVGLSMGAPGYNEDLYVKVAEHAYEDGPRVTRVAVDEPTSEFLSGRLVLQVEFVERGKEPQTAEAWVQVPKFDAEG